MDWNVCSSNGIPKLTCLPILFSNLIYYAFLFAGTVAVALIIWAGIKYIRSGGDAKQTQGARQTLTFAIIGLIIVLASVFIVNLISYVTNVPCIRNFGFTSCTTDITQPSATTCPSDVNFTAAHIPPNSCVCAANATNRFGECDTNGTPGK